MKELLFDIREFFKDKKAAREARILADKEWVAYRKALRILKKQEWSVEFLIALMRMAAKEYHRDKGVYFMIKNKSGEELYLSVDTPIRIDYFDIGERANGYIQRALHPGVSAANKHN